jgi:hypothetical protein
MIFEHFAFRSALVAPAPALVAHDPLLSRPDAGGGAHADVSAGEAAALALATAAATRARAALVLDCGFSYTCVRACMRWRLLHAHTAHAFAFAFAFFVCAACRHAVPIFDGRVQLAGVRRINIGGKVLTNHLKELVSYRHVHTHNTHIHRSHF